TCAGRVMPCATSIAARPDTCGVAIDVPCSPTSSYRSKRGKMTNPGCIADGASVDCQMRPVPAASARVSPPGATTSTCGPVFEYHARPSVRPTAPTEIKPAKPGAKPAGYSTGLPSSNELPAAATTVAPRLMA